MSAHPSRRHHRRRHAIRRVAGLTLAVCLAVGAVSFVLHRKQAAAAKDGVDIRMQSGYRSVDYQTKLYNNKTQYYRDQGCSEADARAKAATIVNPPGYSEHATGLAADLNTPEHTSLDEGFENTAAFRWLCQHAVEYGFILRYPKEAEAVTEITYEPWHWRYVGPENAALISQSGLCFEDAIAVLQKLAAGQSVTG